MGKRAIFQTGGAILLGCNVAIPMVLDAQGLFPNWSYQYHELIGFLAFVAFISWIIFSQKSQINTLTSGDILEVRIIPNKHSPERTPCYYLIPGRSLTAILGLQFVNNSESRNIYIDKAYLELKRWQFPLSRKPLLSMPLETQNIRQNEGTQLRDIEIKPQSKTGEYSILMHKAIPEIKPFPRKSKLILVLEMIGANRKIERDVLTFTHNPKQVSDIPSSQNE